MDRLDIREMQAADLVAVAKVDQDAFSHAAVRAGRTPLAYPRHSAGLDYFRRMAPDLCLVAEYGGRVAGYTIGHRWGATTWIGPVGVAPDLMGRGIGTALLDTFRNRSAALGATTIGLETSILDNVRLYERRGYRAAGLRLLVGKAIGAGAATAAAPAVNSGAAAGADAAPGAPSSGHEDSPLPVFSFMELEPGERHRLTAESRRLAGLVEPGLDHGNELSAVPDSGTGETLVALDSEGLLAGYAVLYLKELRSPEMDVRRAHTDALVWIMTGWPTACLALTAACERAAAAAGATHLKIPCYGGNPHGFALLKTVGYAPEAAFVRMLLAGGVSGTSGKPWQSVPLDFSSWLG